MCGRITLTTPAEVVAQLFGLAAIPGLQPRYNIAPTQPIPAVRTDQESRTRQLVELRWGLVPYWAKDRAIGNRMINARAESLGDKAAFQSAIAKRRCLVVVSGFYEWRGKGKHKQAYLLRMHDGSPFGLAGVWDVWRDREGGKLETCAIVTTAANALVKPIHDRMPVIVPASGFELWLDPEVREQTAIDPLLAPRDTPGLEAVAVSSHVNDPHNDDPGCIEPERTLF